MASRYEVLVRAADAVLERLGRAPVGLVLGSGLSECLDNLEHPQFLDYAEIPGMPTPAVEGHRSALLHGRCGDVPVLALCGRVHMYEGRPHDEVAMGVRLLSLLGVHTLIVTSAVGSADPELKSGSIMLVEDHVNLSGQNVLAGPHEPRFGPRFIDMTGAYDAALLATLEATARVAGVSVSRGVLAHFLGPSYETPMEVRLARSFGARAVSMSMVPDVLVARQRGMRVAGLCCVTNMAAGMESSTLSHDRVLVASAAISERVQTLLSGALPRIGAEPPAGSSR